MQFSVRIYRKVLSAGVRVRWVWEGYIRNLVLESNSQSMWQILPCIEGRLDKFLLGLCSRTSQREAG